MTNDNKRRQPAGIPVGGQFASHDRADSSVSLGSDLPMPEVGDKVKYRGEDWDVLHVDDRTATLSNAAGDLTLASGKGLGLDNVTQPPEQPIPVTLSEKLRSRRGHRFFPANMNKWPSIGSNNDTPLDEIPIVAHYFSPNADWWIAEADPTTGEAWGYARFASMPEGAEWGYIDLTELERLYPNPLYIVERDLDFGKKSSGEVLPKWPA